MTTITGRDTREQNMKDKVGFAQKSVETGITAHANGGQANATQLSAAVNVIATVASGADSVKLPAITADDVGLEVEVINDGANAAQVFGTDPDTIDGVATGTGVVLTNAKRCKYTLASYSGGVGAWLSNMGVKSA